MTAACRLVAILAGEVGVREHQTALPKTAPTVASPSKALTNVIVARSSDPSGKSVKMPICGTASSYAAFPRSNAGAEFSLGGPEDQPLPPTQSRRPGRLERPSHRRQAMQLLERGHHRCSRLEII